MMIPYARQLITEQDIEAVSQVLRSDFLTQGPVVPQFEQAVSRYCGAHYAIATNSATSALHLACLALGLAPGDVLWTSPITFVASANCALYCGAEVDFVDIDPHSGALCPSALAAKLELAEHSGKTPKIVLVVHYAGHSCDMKQIKALSQRYGFKIIEDASHAIGGQYKGYKIGSCQFSEVTVFSFHPVKIITTGEGGMIMTNDAAVAEKIRLLSSHGITRDVHCMSQKDEGAWYYEQKELGYNFRLTDIQAALGLSQLNKLDEFVKRRHHLVGLYHHRLAHLPLTTPKQLAEQYSAWHLYVIQLDLDQLNRTRKHIFSHLRAAGIGVNVHYIPVHLQPVYQRLGFKTGDFPIAEQFYQRIISLPIYADLKDEEVDEVVRCLALSLSD